MQRVSGVRKFENMELEAWVIECRRKFDRSHRRFMEWCAQGTHYPQRFALFQKQRAVADRTHERVPDMSFLQMLVL